MADSPRVYVRECASSNLAGGTRRHGGVVSLPLTGELQRRTPGHWGGARASVFTRTEPGGRMNPLTNPSLSEDTREFLFEIELRAMMRMVGEILERPVGWRG